MSQMSIEEEEKVPGNPARLAARGEAEVANEQVAPADDGFVRSSAAPRSLAQTVRDRKFESALYRQPEAEAPAPEVGKAGSRSAFMDGASGVLDWGAKGLGLLKEADDTATLYGKDIPDVMEATGEQFGGTREAMDSAIAGYAPFQSAIQGAGAWTDGANKALNPIPKVSLGKIGETNIKLGVGTKEILSAASGALQIAQFHKNEGADPNATAIPERAAVAAGQTEFRRALEARRRAGRLFEKAGGHADAGGVGMSPAHTEDGRVQKLLLDEKKRANLKAMQKGMRLALRANDLGKAQEKKGIRSLNEYSMEKTAYLNDKEFVPRKPLGFSDDADADTWAPKKGMIKDGEIAKATDYIEASKSVYDRYGSKGAVKGQDVPAGLMAGMQDSAKLEALDDGYRDDIEGGRSKQKQVAPARFLGGAGQLFEGTLDSKRMVRDGRYKTAYAAKAAELGVITGTKTGAAAAQAGLIAGTGGVAAPLIAAAEAGKHLAFHAKGELGKGMQSASEGLEKLIDPSGLAQEQDNRDLYNKHFGLNKPEQAPAQAPQQDETSSNEVSSIDDAASSDAAPGDAPGGSKVEQPAVHPLFSEAPKPQPLDAPYDEVQQIMNKKHEYFGMNREEFQQVQAQRGAATETPAAPSDVLAQQESAVPQEAPAPTYDEMTADPSARAADVRERGIMWEKQGSSAVLGRQKRTWARAGKDVLWGGAKKVAKGLWSGITGLATLPIHAVKWGWQGAKMAGRGLAAAGRGIGSLFSRKKAAEPANKAREALTAMEKHSEKYQDTAVLDRPQLKVDRLKDLDDLGDLSDEEKVRFRQLREKHAEVYGERDEFGDEPGRVGGSRQAAKEALMAKPEVTRAEERAALREQLAPGKYTPRMASGEILDILRGRAKADLEAEQQGPGDGGDGGGGSGDLLDQINALKGDDAGAPGRPNRSGASVVGDNPKPDRPKPQASKEPGSQASGPGKVPVGDGSGDVIEQIDTSSGEGDSLPAPVGDRLDAQSAAFDTAFGSSARENYYLLHEGAQPGSHLQAAAEGYFPVRRPGAFDPHGAEADAVRRKADLEGELAGLPQGDDADMADATALRAHRARQEDHDRRLEEFERSDPGAFESAGQDRMRAWDAANPRPVRPETTHDRRVRLQGEIAALRDPKEIVAQKWSAHRADVDSYRRRQQYLGTYAPGSRQIDPDLQGFERAHQVNAQAVDAYRQGGAAPFQEAGQPGPGPVMNQLVDGQWQRGAEEEKGAGPVPQGSDKGSDEAAFQPFWKGTRHHYGPGPDDYFEYDESVFKPAGVAKKGGGSAAKEEPVVGVAKKGGGTTAKEELAVAPSPGGPMSMGPLLAPEQAQGIGTLDRGGRPVDIDLGRALNSTPRLERNARGYWGNPDYDPTTDSPEFARDDEFIENEKDNAVEAIQAGRRAGADAEQYRAKFASIRRKHAGGFLNPKNWDRTRARREEKLRSRIQQDYPATPASTASPVQSPPVTAPSSVVNNPVEQGPAIAASRHRTAVPAKSALRSRGGQAPSRVPLPDVADAEKRVAEAFDREATASQPFAAGGEHAGKLDATMRGGVPRTVGLEDARSPLMTGQLLFGATSSAPKVSDQARGQVSDYVKAMGATHGEEVAARAAYARQNRADQGDAAMDIPDFTGPMKPYRTPFFNGYWQREQANPQPTAQATSGKSVRFDSSAEQVPYEQRDPARQFMVKQAVHEKAKQARRAKIDAELNAYKTHQSQSWAMAGDAGAATHRHDRPVPFMAAPSVGNRQQMLIEEE